MSIKEKGLKLVAKRKPISQSLRFDVLEKDKYAVAYYYLVGSYTIRGVTKSNYRTRVCQVLVKEKGDWKVKSGDFTPLHSGSGIPD